MDQGVAAVLGAVVGSVATGGAAFVTSWGAARLQKRKERREGCLALLDEALAVLHLAEDVMIHTRAAQSENDRPDYAQFVASAREYRRRVQKRGDALVLVGPRGVKAACDVLFNAAADVQAAIKQEDEGRLAQAVGDLMRGMDALRQTGSRI